MTERKQYDSRLKATIALEAIKNQQTNPQLASEYGGNPNQVTQWKKQLLEGLPSLKRIDAPKPRKPLNNWSLNCIDKLGN